MVGTFLPEPLSDVSAQQSTPQPLQQVECGQDACIHVETPPCWGKGQGSGDSERPYPLGPGIKPGVSPLPRLPSCRLGACQCPHAPAPAGTHRAGIHAPLVGSWGELPPVSRPAETGVTGRPGRARLLHLPPGSTPDLTRKKKQELTSQKWRPPWP